MAKVLVIITSQIDTSFAPVIGINQTTNTVEAVARAKPPETGSLFTGDAIMALAPSGLSTFKANSNVTLTTVNGGLFANSDNDKGMNILSGPSTINVEQIHVVGGTDGVDEFLDITSTVSPITQESIDAQLSAIPNMPPTPSCSGLPARTAPSGDGVTLQPGYYSSGFTISDDNVTLADGLYCSDGDIRLNGNNTHGNSVQFVMIGGIDDVWDNGSNITFNNLEIYVENSNVNVANNPSSSEFGLRVNRFRFYASGDGDLNLLGGSVFESDNAFIYINEGNLDQNGASSFQVKAPPQDDPDGFGGLLIYIADDGLDYIINGNSISSFQGTILVPQREVQLNGNSEISACPSDEDEFAMGSQIIGYEIQINGNSTTCVNANPNNNYGASTPPVIELAQ